MAAGDVSANISKISGKALFFDGINDDVTIPHSTSLNFTEEFTISFWFKRDGALTANDRVIDKQDAGPANGFTFVAPGADSLGFVIRVGAGTTANINSGTLADKTWYHLVGMLKNGEAKIFVDNVEKAADYASTMVASAVDISLCKRATGPSAYPKCTIDDLRIYDKGLTTQELTDLHTGKPNNKGLVGHWSFNNASDPAHDDSGNGNDGTVTGATSTGGHNTAEDDIISARVNANSKYGLIPLANGREIMMVHIEEA